jgi:DNA-directed RNA polymerase specialized sigma24 family protein
VTGQAGAGLETGTGELAAAWLDAEDATVHRALDWALEHDPDAALRPAVALAPWWADAQIAAQLSISVRTVRSRLDRIRGKTGCRRRADLTRVALDEGLA